MAGQLRSNVSWHGPLVLRFTPSDAWLEAGDRREIASNRTENRAIGLHNSGTSVGKSGNLAMPRIVTGIIAAGVFAATALAQQLAPSIRSLVPNSGPIGTRIMITGKSFGPTGNTVHFGNGGKRDVPSTNAGTTIIYTIPSAVGPSDLNPGIKAPLQIVSPGAYPIAVSNMQGQIGNAAQFTVTQ
jgi:IPT/TIG domain-containing protein